MDRIDYEYIQSLLALAALFDETYQQCLACEIDLVIMSGQDMDYYAIY
jgi:hypothetical protein